MKKVMIGAFVGGVITGAAAMLVYKNIQIGKKSKLHEENYNNLNDLFGQQDSSNKTNIFNDTFSSSFSKSDLVDRFGVNFDSGDENYEDEEDQPSSGIVTWSLSAYNNTEDEFNDEPEDNMSDGFTEYYDRLLNFDNGLNSDSELSLDNDTEDCSSDEAWSSDEADDLWLSTTDDDIEDEFEEESKDYDEDDDLWFLTADDDTEDEEYDEEPDTEDEEYDEEPDLEDFEEYNEESDLEDFEEYNEESEIKDIFEV